MSTKRCNNSTETKDGQSTSRTSQLNSFSSRHIYIYTQLSHDQYIYIYTTGHRRQTLVSSRPGSRHEGASPPPNLGHSTMFINTAVIRQSIRLIHNNAE